MFAENLRKIRLNRSLTQSEIAEKIGVKKATVSSWEVGRTEPNLETIERLAEILHCNKSDLVGKDRIDNMQIINAENLSKENFEKLYSYYEFLLKGE